ncbi:iron-sulfur flavoprotein [Desulfocucumis palustris]|uniref:Iron-sulfur flavoprotein n=1 Tax=Desulfocucumis palustris TaxID=1898651 RepID=A0A2L2XFJ3_9FIRM|nr:flavodoxin family protein [Desulfocucumis palustris]GBF35119.1 iron-sulfur flavoprotein [Desulfocucumis palustris]
MKKVLGLVISERRLGNTEILLKEIIKNVPDPCSRELIRLTELTLKSCKGCYQCLIPGNSCSINDDFLFLREHIKDADALIIGLPVYFLGPHAYFKLLMDRLLCAGYFAEHTRGKPCVLVIPFGMRGWEGYARAAALTLPALLKMKLIDCWLVHAALPGESVLNEVNAGYAGQLGANLFNSPAGQWGKLDCPRCGSDLLRFLPGGLVECPICSGRGKIVARDGDLLPDFTLEPSTHRFSEAGLEEHFKGWLVGMKERFKTQKDILKKVQQPYKEYDWWVRPPGQKNDK